MIFCRICLIFFPSYDCGIFQQRARFLQYRFDSALGSFCLKISAVSILINLYLPLASWVGATPKIYRCRGGLLHSRWYRICTFAQKVIISILAPRPHDFGDLGLAGIMVGHHDILRQKTTYTSNGFGRPLEKNMRK